MCSLFILAFGFILLFMVKEPVVKHKKHLISDYSILSADQTFKNQARKLTKLVREAISSDCIFAVCFFGNFIIRMNIIMLSSFMTLWTSSFVDEGVLRN